MTNFKTPLRGQQELTLLGSEKTTSSLVVFIPKKPLDYTVTVYLKMVSEEERGDKNEAPL